MILNRRHSLGICARLAAALQVIAVALVLVLPLGHAAWAVSGSPEGMAVSVQTPDGGENRLDCETGLLCCGHALCHMQADVPFASSVGPLTPTAECVLRPVGDDMGASRALHPPRKPPRLA